MTEQPSAEAANGVVARRHRAWPRHLAWAALLLPALALRLPGIATTSVWHDEAMTIHTAGMGLYDLVVTMSVANNQPPLIFLLFKIWAVVSWSPVWLRLLPVGLSLIGVVYAVRWLRLWDDRAGWIAGLLVATAPLMIHYAQEIRAYALMYTCMSAGLYYGERLARAHSRGDRAALLVCTCVLAYAHYVGLVVAVALWVYTALRGAGLRRTFFPACAWVALAMPILALGIYHAGQKQESGFWVPPLDWATALGMVSHWTGTEHLTLWEYAASNAAVPWIALVGRALLALALGVGLVLTIAAKPHRERLAALSMLATGFVFVSLMAVVGWIAVPIALPRTTFPAFIPLVGALALSGARREPAWMRRAGTAACLLLALVWAVTWLSYVTTCPERRPEERPLFAAVAEKFQPGDVMIVFTPEMQASAGYFMREVAQADQIHSTDQPRLADSPGGLKLRPIPRSANSTWFSGFRAAIADRQARYPAQHSVWLIDLGVRSVGDRDRRQVRRWLDQHYDLAEEISVGSQWTLGAHRFVPRATGQSTAQGPPPFQGGGRTHTK